VAGTEQQGTENLSARLARFPAHRYPVQHATTQFHLGTSRLAAGDIEPALEALGIARDIFARVGMRLEHAKATNMLGVALRANGRVEPARTAFEEARSQFTVLGQLAEAAAASYNLGLVYADLGDATAARSAWERAQGAFLEAGRPAQAAAAAREQGASLLTTGEVDAARQILAEAMQLADRGRDEVGYGAAGNVLGLAHLAADAPADAVEAFRLALGAFPRSTPLRHAHGRPAARPRRGSAAPRRPRRW